MSGWNDPYALGLPDDSSLGEYLEWKVELLTEEFEITPTEEEYDKLRRLDNKHDIDRAIRKIIKSRWKVD